MTASATTRRRMSPEAREASILAAADKHLADVGLASFSPEVVAAAAGASPALVRHYFGGREGLLESLAEYLCSEVVTLFEDASLDEGDRVRRYLAFLNEHRWGHALWLSRGVGAGSGVERVVAEARERLVATVMNEIPGAADARLIGLVLVGAIESVVEDWLREGLLDLDGHTEVLVSLRKQFLDLG